MLVGLPGDKAGVGHDTKTFSARGRCPVCRVSGQPVRTAAAVAPRSYRAELPLDLHQFRFEPVGFSSEILPNSPARQLDFPVQSPESDACRGPCCLPLQLETAP